MKKFFKTFYKVKKQQNDVSINISAKTVVTENYYRKDMDHTISNNNYYLKTNFDYAASTGSLYKNDIFENCSMYQTDFEFCLFENCEFSSKKKVVSSFNCSDFVNGKFHNINFKACTFTGALFDKCNFVNVDIQSSTLENALFDNCSFYNMNLSRLNMNFVHLINPNMSNVILASEQIPYIFGCMKYLLNTNDIVKISSNGILISISDYFKLEVPNLIDKWVEQSQYDYKAYFPLANIYIATKDYNEAQKALSSGIAKAVSGRDFRMIKFYCKLISESDAFDNKQRHTFYNLIKCFSPSNEQNLFVQRNFIRNIGEIQSILFSHTKKASLKLKFLTNISINDSNLLQKIIEHIFSISKMKYNGFSNDVEIILCQNSPLTISLNVSSEEDNIIYILNQCIAISNKTIKSDNKLTAMQKYQCNDLYKDTDNLILFCCENNINLSLIEYFLENVTESNNLPNCYFANNNLYLE